MAGPLKIVVAKRNGKELDEGQIGELMKAYVSGRLPDYQMAAFLMAVYFRGFSFAETAAWTRAMVESGTVLDLKDFSGPKIDKHSTGGVGDKTSLILTPLVASLGITVPMICGRSLGFTGGTIDKLESIPGFRTALSLMEARRILAKTGCVMMAQSEEVAPADRKLYALRDVTGTVESVPLIASSILSKKAAEGIEGVVFDVKFGDGAFFRSLSEASRLAKTLVKLSGLLKLKSVALLSSMEQPLGNAVGNALEVEEAIEVMKGGGPKDLKDLTLSLAGWMLVLGSKAKNFKDGFSQAREALETGAALNKFREVVEAQGGEGRVVEDPSLLPQAGRRLKLNSLQSGFLSKIHTRRLAEFLRSSGAGRSRLGESVDPAVGLVLLKKLGDKVKKGEPVAVLHVGPTASPSLEEVSSLFEVTRKKVRSPALVRRVFR